MLEFDVLVVGGGPAGSTCAATLARSGCRVGILERSTFSHFRIGETLDAAISFQIPQVDHGEKRSESPCREIVSKWGDERLRRSDRAAVYPFGSGRIVDRARFDAGLFQIASAAGATSYEGAKLTSADRRDGVWRYEFVAGKRTAVGRAQWVVDATGRTPSCDPLFDDERIYADRLVGVAFLDESRVTADPTAPKSTFVESASEGWWYATELPHGGMLGVFLTDADLVPRSADDRARHLRRSWERTEVIRRQCPHVETAISERRWRCFDAHTGCRRRPLVDGLIAIGDAIVSFDPLSGTGVLAAVQSGTSAAECLLSPDAERRDALAAFVRRSAESYNRRIVERIETYDSEARWPQDEFWRRRRSPFKDRQVAGGE